MAFGGMKRRRARLFAVAACGIALAAPGHAQQSAPDATELDPDAPLAAAMRAVQSRDAGNVLKFCHWRQIERLSALLASNNIQGSLH